MPSFVPLFQAFSADQYQAMLTPQVQAISSAKRDSLTMAQQDAIKSVIARDPDEEDPWRPDDDDDDCSGAYYALSHCMKCAFLSPELSQLLK